MHSGVWLDPSEQTYARHAHVECRPHLSSSAQATARFRYPRVAFLFIVAIPLCRGFTHKKKTRSKSEGAGACFFSCFENRLACLSANRDAALIHLAHAHYFRTTCWRDGQVFRHEQLLGGAAGGAPGVQLGLHGAGQGDG